MTFRSVLQGEPLTVNNVDKVFRYDKETGFLYRKYLGGREKKTGTVGGFRKGLITAYNRISFPVTHIIWLIVYGEFPKQNIDHKDLNAKNNKLDNLRETSQSGNHANIKVTSRSKTGVKGVFWDYTRQKFCSYIGFNYKSYFIGRFDSIEEAKEAYDKKAKELFGEFARS